MLKNSLGLTVVGPRRLDPSSEKALSAWMRNHLELAVHPYPDRDALEHLESLVLKALDPPLNLKKMPTTDMRRMVSALRREIRGAPSSVPSDRVARNVGTTLHGEIVEILSEKGPGGMTARDIADEVNARGRYHRKDGQPVPVSQIGARVRKYPTLFEKNESKVYLR